MRYIATSKGLSHDVAVERDQHGWRVRLDERDFAVDVLPVGPTLYSLLIDGRSYQVDVLEVEGAYVVLVSGQPFRVELRRGRQVQARPAAASAGVPGGGTVAAPMPGKVVRLLVGPGDVVEAGDGVAVIEAMKMENELKAPTRGRVREVRSAVGRTVTAGEVLMVLE